MWTQFFSSKLHFCTEWHCQTGWQVGFVPCWYCLFTKKVRTCTDWLVCLCCCAVWYDCRCSIHPEFERCKNITIWKDSRSSSGNTVHAWLLVHAAGLCWKLVGKSSQWCVLMLLHAMLINNIHVHVLVLLWSSCVWEEDGLAYHMIWSE